MKNYKNKISGEEIPSKRSALHKNKGYSNTEIFKAFSKLFHSSLIKYFLSAFIVSAVSLIMYYLHLHIGYQAVSLVFLFIISLMPLMNFRPGQIFLAAVMSAFIWNYFFIPPSFTLRIGKVEDTLMFGMYFIIATVSGLLISRIHTQQVQINQREKRTAALYNLARELSSAKSLDNVTECAVAQLKETFNAEVVFIFFEDEKKLNLVPHPASTFKIDDAERNIAQWVFINGERAGRFTDTMPITYATYFPLTLKGCKLGVIGFMFENDPKLYNDSESLFNTFLSQIGIAVEREYLKEQAKKNLVIAESEKLYKSLFDSISHELKTPITTIICAVSSFKDERIIRNPVVLSRLVKETNIAAERLNRLVENLLDITRLESGNLKPKKEWHSIEDLINSVLDKIRIESEDHKIILEVNENIGLLYFDFTLIEQALINIIHNCVEYTSVKSIITIKARRTSENIILNISDNGKGFPEETIKNLFEKFYRVPGTKAGGIGLGLSIAKGFIEAHGGKISAQNKKTLGAEFIILLPLN